jgi:EamA-like transporter family
LRSVRGLWVGKPARRSWRRCSPSQRCTALAYVIYFRILSGAGATNVLPVTFVAPAISVILGAIFLLERLLARQFLGFALIAIGLAFIDGRPTRALAAANSNFARRYPRLHTGEKSR